jgi:hypothetical protein
MKIWHKQFKNLHQEELDKAFKNACSKGQLKKVKYLLTSSELNKHANIHSQEGEALIKACRNNHYDVIDYLVNSKELKENLSIHTRKDYALIVACEENNVDLAKYLLTSPTLKEHIDIHTNANSPGNTDRAFQIALIYKNLEILNYFITELNIERTPTIDKLIAFHDNEIKDAVENLFKARDLYNKLNKDLVSNEKPQPNTHKVKI